VPRLCDEYPDICLITEEKARTNLGQGSRRMPTGTMKTEYTERNIHNNKNTYTTELKVYMYKTYNHVQNDKKRITQRISLHCNTSLHFTTHHYTATLHYTSPHFTHYTYRHFTSSHLHFTILSFALTHLHFPPP
jgi:hypothetical protein